MSRQCDACGSDRYYCKGLCKRCYNRKLRTGSTEMQEAGSLLERLWRRVEVNEQGCWLWGGATTASGYATMFWNGKQTTVHRITWVEVGGQELIPGLVLDHLCRVRSCVNPKHLEQVSQSVNVRRGDRHSDRCKNGHEYDGTHLRPGRRYSYRTCSKCKSIRSPERPARGK